MHAQKKKPDGESKTSTGPPRGSAYLAQAAKGECMPRKNSLTVSARSAQAAREGVHAQHKQLGGECMPITSIPRGSTCPAQAAKRVSAFP